jgi:hypothetical protein
MARDRAKAGDMPRWVKVFAWVGVGAVLLVAIMLASGHGPWQHMGGMHL